MSGSSLIGSIVNFREGGGLVTGDGRRIRTGVLYRSAHLGVVTDDDLGRLTELGVRTVLDLRTDQDIAADGEDRLPDGVSLLRHPVGDIGTERTDIRGTMLHGTPAEIEAAFGNGRSVELMQRGAVFYVGDPRMRAAVAAAARALMEPGRRGLLVHCSAGKDRTGWMCAALQLALGAEHDAVIENYMASNDFRRAAAQLTGVAEHRGIDPEIIRPFIEVRREYMESSIAEMERRHGDIAGYFESLSISADQLAALRADLVE